MLKKWRQNIMYGWWCDCLHRAKNKLAARQSQDPFYHPHTLAWDVSSLSTTQYPTPGIRCCHRWPTDGFEYRDERHILNWMFCNQRHQIKVSNSVSGSNNTCECGEMMSEAGTCYLHHLPSKPTRQPSFRHSFSQNVECLTDQAWPSSISA